MSGDDEQAILYLTKEKLFFGSSDYLSLHTLEYYWVRRAAIGAQGICKVDRKLLRAESNMLASIILDQSFPHYTNLDFISGKVYVRTQTATTVSSIVVKLEGESRTRLLVRLNTTT